MPFSTRWSAGWVGSAETGGLFLVGKDASPEQQMLKLREQMCALRQRRLDADEVALALSQFGPVWDSLAPREQARLVQLLIEKVEYDGANGRVVIAFYPAGIKALADELAAEQRNE